MNEDKTSAGEEYTPAHVPFWELAPQEADKALQPVCDAIEDIIQKAEQEEHK